MSFNPNQPRARDGKWDGAGGASGAHAAGTNNVGKPSVSDRVLDVIRNNPNGFSVSPNGDQPTKGYMVSVPGRSKVLERDALKGSAGHGIISEYARANADALSQPGAHIGGWHDSKSGKVYLDVSRNISRAREAVREGKKANQIAIWDVKRKREIQTGGTGK